MFEFLKNHPRYLIGAIVVHLFFLVLFGVGFHFKSERRAATELPQTVTVKTVDERLVEKELKKFEAQEQQEQRRQEELVRKRKAEEQRLTELRKQREAEQRKEKERLALLEKQKQELAEKKRQEELRLKELERKRKEEEQRQEQARREQELKEKLQAEEQRLQQEQAIAAQRRAELAKKQSLIDQYMNLIEAKVYQKWVKPPSADKGLVCELQVRLIPSGEVINIELSKSSGDPVYDQSVMAAVRKASPLPLPPAEANLFEVFRDLHLPVRADKKT